MKPALLVLALALPLVAAPAAASTDKLLAQALLPSAHRLKVTSATFPANGVIPFDNSGYGKSLSPQLSWSGAPAGTRSFVVLAEDPDAGSPKPFVHWVVYDVPPASKGFAANALPAGAVAGTNGAGKPGYRGPHPPPDGFHHYHFEVFALDRRLGLKPGADRDAVVAAMRGHVLAEGETIGLFRKP
jgi:Raf kinase inhibitor-like YbhB/YbcL family protein